MVVTNSPVMTVNEADITPDIQPVGPRATPVPVQNNTSPTSTPTHRDMAGKAFYIYKCTVTTKYQSKFNHSIFIIMVHYYASTY